MGGGYDRKGDGFVCLRNVRSLLFGVFYMYVKRATICTGWCWTEIVCRLWPFGTALSQRGETLGGFSLDLLWLSLLFSEIRYRFFFGIRLGSFFSSWTTGVWGFPVWTGGPLCSFSLVCPYRIHHVYPWCAKSIPRLPCDNGRSTAGKNGRQSAGNAGESRKGVRARRKSIGKWSRAMDPRRKWHRK